MNSYLWSFVVIGCHENSSMDRMFKTCATVCLAPSTQPFPSDFLLPSSKNGLPIPQIRGNTQTANDS